MRNRFGIVLSLLALLGPALSWSASLVPSDQLIAQSGDKYPVFPMKSGYLEKDKRKGVLYFTAEEREPTRALIINGLVYTNKGEAYPDSSLAGGTYQYVMDQAGNVYIFDDMPTIRHSSIFAGQPVAAAGDVQIESGFITYIDVNSGHYFVLSANSGRAKENITRELTARYVELKTLNKKARPVSLDEFDLFEPLPDRETAATRP